jgi:hypothetical protein
MISRFTEFFKSLFLSQVPSIKEQERRRKEGFCNYCGKRIITTEEISQRIAKLSKYKFRS